MAFLSFLNRNGLITISTIFLSEIDESRKVEEKQEVPAKVAQVEKTKYESFERQG
jgi:hypothetical protein